MEKIRCSPGDPKCYVFIRYSEARAQAAKNCFIKNLPIHRNYTGVVCGVAERVEVVEGSWDRNKTIAILMFDCQCEAVKWLQSTPEIKQHDWLDQVDIIMANLKGDLPESPEGVFELIDLDIFDYGRFSEEYTPRVLEYLDKNKIKRGVIATNEVTKMRGLWNTSNREGRPNWFILNKFKDEQEFEETYNSEEYQQMKQIRQETSGANIVKFVLRPLCCKGQGC